MGEEFLTKISIESLYCANFFFFLSFPIVRRSVAGGSVSTQRSLGRNGPIKVALYKSLDTGNFFFSNCWENKLKRLCSFTRTLPPSLTVRFYRQTLFGLFSE